MNKEQPSGFSEKVRTEELDRLIDVSASKLKRLARGEKLNDEENKQLKIDLDNLLSSLDIKVDPERFKGIE